MDVDPSISHSKRVAPSLLFSSFPEKRARIPLPDSQLDALRNHMKHTSDLMNWRTRVKEAKEAKDNDLIWWQTHSPILMDLIGQLRATDMESVVIPHPTIGDTRNLFESFNEKQLEQWENGVENGIEKDDWSMLIVHRAYIFDYQVSQGLIITTAKLQIPKVAIILPGSYEQAKGAVISGCTPSLLTTPHSHRGFLGTRISWPSGGSPVGTYQEPL